MSYSSLRKCVEDLERNGHLVRVKEEVDPNLEIAEIHRRFYDAKGPAVLFERVKGSPFQAVSNIYGTIDRTEFIFRKTIEKALKVIELKADPSQVLKNPLRYLSAPFTALTALPMKSRLGAPIRYQETTIDQLPQVKSWKDDGGAFVTLPQVFTLPPGEKDPMKSNVGMYRIQLSGNDYIPNEEIGLHYQLHRGIGIHHKQYNNSNEAFKASIFIGGPPSHAFSAIMPLPEGLSELTLAGMLGGRRFRYTRHNGHFLSADADFVITGTIVKDQLKPEGPFGDHLGYYSLEHDFPVMKVDKVYHRKNPLWHFTVVGRPPQEDSSFGYLVHRLGGDIFQHEFPGVREVNAVDAAGVHPLLLAIGSERYMPFREQKPEEILTQANHILGKNQTTLAKYLFIAAEGDDPDLKTHNIPHFLNHFMERVDWTRDLHFQTKTTIDTLDYSGSGWNAGSKVVIACCGEVKRNLTATFPTDFVLPQGFGEARFFQKGILVINAPKFEDSKTGIEQARSFCDFMQRNDLQHIPLIVLVDDSTFTTANLNNFVWVTFTRSNPSHDMHGVDEFVEHKHWGCHQSLVIDARIKPHHAPPLIKDKKITEKVDKLFSSNGSLHGLI